MICIYARDIEKGKIEGDFGSTYGVDMFRLIDELRDNYGIEVKAIVITRFNNQPQAFKFKTVLEKKYKSIFTLSS